MEQKTVVKEQGQPKANPGGDRQGQAKPAPASKGNTNQNKGGSTGR